MKRFSNPLRTRTFLRMVAGSAVLAACAFSLPVQAGNLNIEIGVNGEVAPGVYGSVRVDNRRSPRVVYQQPIVIERVRTRTYIQPVYLHVPPGHAKRWDRYCGRYQACATPVYFVKSRDYYQYSPPRYSSNYFYQVQPPRYSPRYEQRRERRYEDQRERYVYREDNRNHYRNQFRGKHHEDRDNFSGEHRGRRHGDDDQGVIVLR
ncbi:MAG: hypothetical protein HC848_10805 [Limnobacter sp.]|nr:hypothetical protein [Limnobacter sp.]